MAVSGMPLLPYLCPFLLSLPPLISSFNLNVNCLERRSRCIRESTCLIRLDRFDSICGNSTSECSSSSPSDCVHLIRDLRQWLGEEDCECWPLFGAERECDLFRRLLYEHPCERMLDPRRRKKGKDRLGVTTVESVKRRTTRSPSSDDIREWKKDLSGHLYSLGTSHLLKDLECDVALHEICLKHLSCGYLWKLFREKCAVDGQNTCRMQQREACWQSFEGLLWTGLGRCHCSTNSSDCHWIRLHTNFNKCIYQISQSTGASLYDFQPLSPPRLSTGRVSFVDFAGSSLATSPLPPSPPSHPYPPHPYPIHSPHPTHSPHPPAPSFPSPPDPRLSYRTDYPSPSRIQSFPSPPQDRIPSPSLQATFHHQNSRPSQPSGNNAYQVTRDEERRRIEEERRRREEEKRRTEEEKKRIEEKGRNEEMRKEELKREEEKKEKEEKERREEKRRLEEQEKKKREEEEKKGEEERELRRKKIEEKRRRKEEEKKEEERIREEKRMMMEEDKKEKERIEEEKRREEEKKKELEEREMKRKEERIKIREKEKMREERRKMKEKKEEEKEKEREEEEKITREEMEEGEKRTTVGMNEGGMVKGKKAKETAKEETKEDPKDETKKDPKEDPTAKEVDFSSSSGGCNDALTRCESDLTCKFHLGELKTRCQPRSTHCHQHKCAEAIRRFVKFVPRPLVEALSLCSCSNEETTCEVKETLYPSCLYQHSDKQCGIVQESCEDHPLCRSLRSTLSDACPVVQGACDGGVSCTSALLAARGSILDAKCQCPLNGEECLRIRSSLLPTHPCLDEARREFVRLQGEEKTTTSTKSPEMNKGSKNLKKELNTTKSIPRQRITTTKEPPIETKEEIPPWITTTTMRTTTTEFATHPPPPAEGCAMKDVLGRSLFFHVGTIFRRNMDWAGRCTSWCECPSQDSLECAALPCLEDATCESEYTTTEFGERLYLKDRGACMCESGVFVCDTPQLLPELYPGLYLLVGYSLADVALIRLNIDRSKLEESGLLSSQVSKDLAGQMQIAFERILPQGLQCRLVVMHDFPEEGNMILRVEWFGKMDILNQTREHWQWGMAEKACSTYANRLAESFDMNDSLRLQLVLSTVKQIRVLDLLDGLPSSLPSLHSLLPLILCTPLLLLR